MSRETDDENIEVILNRLPSFVGQNDNNRNDLQSLGQGSQRRQKLNLLSTISVTISVAWTRT